MYAYNSSAVNTSNVGTVTFSPPSGSLLILYSITSAGGGTPTITVTDNGAGSSWINSVNNVSVSSQHTSVAYCLSAGTGITTITVTYNGGVPGEANIAVIAYTGLTSPSFVGTSTGNGQAAPGTGVGAITTNALACGSTTALFVGMCCDSSGDNAGQTAVSPMTSRFNLSTGGTAGQIFMADPNADVTGSQTATWTTATRGSDTYISYGIAFTDVTGVIAPSQGSAVIGGNSSNVVQGNIITPSTAKIRDAVRSFFLPRYRGLVRG